MTSTTTETTEFRIPRSGDTTLTGTGRLIASVNNDPTSQTKKDERYHRWHNLALYQTTGGKYVLHIAYRTNFTTRENNHDTALVFATVKEALFFAREIYNPLEYYVGIPPHHVHYPKDGAFKAEFRERYRADCLDLAAQATASGTLGETKID